MSAKRVSKAAFDRWYMSHHGKPATEAQIANLYRAKDRAEAALELARTRAQLAIESVMSYEDSLAAWEAAHEAANE